MSKFSNFQKYFLNKKLWIKLIIQQKNAKIAPSNMVVAKNWTPWTQRNNA
jgi:hypothetical protein